MRLSGTFLIGVFMLAGLSGQSFSAEGCNGCPPGQCNGNPPICGVRKVANDRYDFSITDASKDELLLALDKARSTVQDLDSIKDK